MRTEFVSKKTLRKYKQYRRVYPTRRAAFRAAKRDRNIPQSQHPDDVIYPHTAVGDHFGLDERNVRLYIFNIGIIAVAIHIREDKEAFYTNGKDDSDQLPHFNSGRSPGKLKHHHYWKND